MSTNLFGLQIEGLDLAFFLRAIRVAFVLTTLVAAALAARRGASEKRVSLIVLAVGMAGHALAWFATMFPLPNVYGANGSMDRENHLGWANVVALGFSPLRTFQVNHIHFEPAWPLLTAIASGFNVDRVGLVFQIAPLFIGLALLITVRFAWSRNSDAGDEARVEAAFAALGALLLMSVPGDSEGRFRNPWALTLLLKPNHALGLVLSPLAALALARARDWKSRIAAGFMLQLVGWAFVIHMALFAAGLVVFTALSWIGKRRDRVRDLVDSAATVGLNLVMVSPYLAMLMVGYLFTNGSAHSRVAPMPERFIEGPLRMGTLLLLSGFGAWHAYHRRNRLGRILASQWIAAHLAWQAFPILAVVGQAREEDEIFYWCRFWTGLFAGVGMFEGIRRLAGRARSAPALAPAGGLAAAALLLLLPSLLPAWWDPVSGDQYFVAAREPIPDWIAEPTRFIRNETDPAAVFTGDRNYARWIAAYGARRVLLANSLNNPGDTKLRLRVEGAVLGDGARDLLREGRTRYALGYVLATSRPLDQATGLTLDMLRSKAHLRVVYDKEFSRSRVMIFRIEPENPDR